MAADMLRNADDIARRGLPSDQLIIDADVHHLAVLHYLSPYMEGPWRRTIATTPTKVLHEAPAWSREVAGRIKRQPIARFDEETPPTGIRELLEHVGRMGVDYAIVFPNDLLGLADSPMGGFEAAVAMAYARWATERVLPYENRIGLMLYLPFSDPEATLRLIERYGDRPGVVGAVIVGQRFERIHSGAFLKVYAALEERGLPLGIHAGAGGWSHPLNLFDRFIGVHTVSFPLYNAVNLASLVLGGIPERFPRLRLIFFEAGAAILPTLMARLDTAFLMRPSEAPLLRMRPSEYMRRFYYTIQPIEQPEQGDQMRAIFDQIGRTQILFATDYPHWDMDLPSSITQLGFLSEEDRRNIFAYNAIRAFGLDPARLPAPRRRSGGVPAGVPAR